MGTSMATPIVAGAAVLVRQYFEDGWYPNGSPVSQYGFNPSAPLVKAVMLGVTVCSIALAAPELIIEVGISLMCAADLVHEPYHFHMVCLQAAQHRCRA